jgi:hypothetical protein
VDCGAGGRHSAPLIAACSKGARKSPALLACKESGAAGYKRHSRKASLVFRSKAIQVAGIGSRKKKPRRMTGLKTVMHGATQGSLKQRPHPFTFAGQHVQIGAAAGRLLAITFSDMTRCHPRVVPSPARLAASVSMMSDHSLRRGGYSAGQSTLFARQVATSRAPRLRMRFLWTGYLSVRHDFWPRPLSVGTHPTVTTCKANTGKMTQFLRFSATRLERCPRHSHRADPLTGGARQRAAERLGRSAGKPEMF